MKAIRFWLFAFIVISLAGASSTAQAQTHETKLAPADLSPSALFGFVTASNQQILAVGAPLQSSVYVYIRNSSGWSKDAEITAPGMGFTVAVDGNSLVLGSTSGVLLYTRQNGFWMQEGQIGTASSPSALSMNKGRVAVAGSGVVSIFERDELTLAWSERARFRGEAGSGFGVNLALTDSTLVVGEPFLNGGTGSVVVYGISDGVWSQQTVIKPGDPAAGTQFGLGLGVSGGTIVVGAPGAGVDETLGGAAYVFVNNNGAWMQQAKLESPSIDPGQDFGTSLAIVGNTLLVGAYENNDEIGTAHVFVRNGSTWILTNSLFPDDGASGQRFANNVTMPDTNTFVCGSPTASVSGKFSAGAVYLFTK